MNLEGDLGPNLEEALGGFLKSFLEDKTPLVDLSVSL